MTEKIINPTEQVIEHIPTPEEVHEILRELTNKEYTVTKKREDDQGLYLLDVTVPGKAEGEVTQYSYTRKGKYPEGSDKGSWSVTEIYFVYYKDGIPEPGGTTAARLVDGQWKII